VCLASRPIAAGIGCPEQITVAVENEEMNEIKIKWGYIEKLCYSYSLLISYSRNL